MKSPIYWAAVALLLGGCAADGESGGVTRDAATLDERVYAGTYETRSVQLTAEDLERGRLDPGWRRFVDFDSTAAVTSIPDTATWESITPDAVNRGQAHLPLSGDRAGPTVLRVQLLLDRALFSPGIIDGRWGKNSEKAVYWLQRREGLRATGTVDAATYERLVQLAGGQQELIVSQRLTEDDVSGPFVKIPDDIYDKAKLDCLCYESLEEKLGERFHASPALLKKLNPGVDLSALRAGATLYVPRVRDAEAGRGMEVARLLVSDGGHYLHALDSTGRILFHFPTTLGSEYNPSPSGDYRVTSITMDPWWHYQPDLIENAEPGPDAKIPPGPNNAVGVVWMALSKPHYGIHGTSAPETIGYTTSSGCVRLTNWDARFLAERISSGVPVEFRDPS
jgi:lipoprotein-anchoring transpeptidase ErfK/SrfK